MPNPASLRPHTWAFGIAIVCFVCHREGACDRGDLSLLPRQNNKSEIATPSFRTPKLVALLLRGFAMTRFCQIPPPARVHLYIAGQRLWCVGRKAIGYMAIGCRGLACQTHLTCARTVRHWVPQESVVRIIARELATVAISPFFLD